MRTFPYIRPRRLTTEEDVVGRSLKIGVLKETAGLETLLLQVLGRYLPGLEAAAETAGVTPSVHGWSGGGSSRYKDV